MKIRLIQAWKIWSIGHEFPGMPDNQASELIRRGIAEQDKPVRRVGMRAGRDYVTR